VSRNINRPVPSSRQANASHTTNQNGAPLLARRKMLSTFVSHDNRHACQIAHRMAAQKAFAFPA
jgi:hypothetical protein